MTNKFTATALVLGLGLAFAAPAFAAVGPNQSQSVGAFSAQTDASSAAMAASKVAVKGHGVQVAANQTGLSQDSDRYNTP